MTSKHDLPVGSHNTLYEPPPPAHSNYTQVMTPFKHRQWLDCGPYTSCRFQTPLNDDPYITAPRNIPWVCMCVLFKH